MKKIIGARGGVLITSNKAGFLIYKEGAHRRIELQEKGRTRGVAPRPARTSKGERADPRERLSR